MRYAWTAVLSLCAAGCVRSVGSSYEVTLDKACDATRGALTELGLPLVSERRDFQEGVFSSRMADDRKVTIVCGRRGDRITDIWVKVGGFETAENREAKQSIHNRIVSKLGLPVPPPSPPAAVPAQGSSDEMRKMYKGSVPACYDAAMKACSGRGYQPQQYQRSGDEKGSITASGKERSVTIALQRHAQGNRTQVTIRVSGGSTDDAKKAAKELHEKLGDELKEKGEDE